MHADSDDGEFGVDGDGDGASGFIIVVLVCVWVVGAHHSSFLHPFGWLDVVDAGALPERPRLRVVAVGGVT